MRTYDITTRCRRVDGSEEVDEGIARVQDLNTNAKMEWRFLPLAIAWWPFAWTDYWIVDLAPDYSYAMAGDAVARGDVDPGAQAGARRRDL